MKALQKTMAMSGATLNEIPIPAISENDLLVKVKATAICKSDVEVYEWSELLTSMNFPLPITMGHEFLGEVVEAGRNIKDIKAGDHIAGETHVPCGYCHTCRTGNQHICSNNMGIIGRSVDGSFAEYMRVPGVSAVKVDKQLPAAQGAMLEPLAVAIHSLTKSDIRGKTVAVLGCGTIGLMTVELAKILGATKVIAVSTTQSKLDSALKHGADLAINSKQVNFVDAVMEATKGLGISTVIENTGNEEVINQAIDILQIAGTLVFVGMINNSLTIRQCMKRLVFRELNVTGIFGRRMYETWDILMNVLESGKLDLAHYVAAELPLTDYKKGIEMFPSLSGRVIMYP